MRQPGPVSQPCKSYKLDIPCFDLCSSDDDSGEHPQDHEGFRSQSIVRSQETGFHRTSQGVATIQPRTSLHVRHEQANETAVQLSEEVKKRIEFNRQQALKRKAECASKVAQCSSVSNPKPPSSFCGGDATKAFFTAVPVPVPEQDLPAASSACHPSFSDLPRHLRKALLPFQVAGVRFGIAKDGRCLIGDEMGLGKTLQAIALTRVFKHDWPVLCVMPASMRWTWAEELEKWLPELRPGHVKVVRSGSDTDFGDARFVLVTFDLLVRCAELRAVVEGRGFGSIIVDECHKCKDARTQTTQHVASLARTATRRILLSGTPALNRPVELFSQVRMLDPQLLGSWTEFTKRFCDAREVRVGRAMVWDFKGAANLPELNARLGAVMIRRRKEEVLDQLPEKRRQLIPIELKEKAVRERLEAEYAEWRQTEPGGERNQLWSRAMQSVAEAKAPWAADYVSELVEGGAKLLVFAHFERTLDKIAETLSRNRIAHIRIDGKVLPDERRGLMQQFQQQEHVRAAVLSVTAAGQGITLTAANTVVFAELRCVPGEMLQAEDRAHRIGQKLRVTVHYLLARRTIDETLWRMVRSKLHQTSSALDGAAEHISAEHVAHGCGDFDASLDFDPQLHTHQRSGGMLAALRPGQATGIAAYFSRSAQGEANEAGVRPATTECGVPRAKHGRQLETRAGHVSRGQAEREQVEEVEEVDREGSRQAEADAEGQRSWEHGQEASGKVGGGRGKRAGGKGAEGGEKREGGAGTPQRERVVICIDSDGEEEEEASDSEPVLVRVSGEPTTEAGAALRGSESEKQDAGGSRRQRWHGGSEGAAAGACSGTSSEAGEQAGAAEGEGGVKGKTVGDGEGGGGRTGCRRQEVSVQVSLNTHRMFFYADAEGQQLLGRVRPESVEEEEENETEEEEEEGARKSESGRGETRARWGGREWMPKLVGDFAAAWRGLRAIEQRRLGNALIALPTTQSVGTALRAALGARGTPGPEAEGGSTVRHSAELNFDAAGLCGWCGAAVSARPFCSMECRRKYEVKQSSAAVRRQLRELEHGVCQKCGLDTTALFHRIKDIPKGPERMSALMGTKFKLNARQLNDPKEGDFWQADHIRPVAEGGGEASLDNFRTLCTPCHARETGRLMQRLAGKRLREAAEGTRDIRACFLQPRPPPAEQHGDPRHPMEL